MQMDFTVSIRAIRPSLAVWRIQCVGVQYDVGVLPENALDHSNVHGGWDGTN